MVMIDIEKVFCDLIHMMNNDITSNEAVLLLGNDTADSKVRLFNIIDLNLSISKLSLTVEVEVIKTVQY
jgi:hypothetical protein